MNLLYANDAPAAYPNSWYAATANTLPRFPTLKGAHKADVCVVGGGYTGLSAALHLAEAGRDVVLIDAQRVGLVPLGAMAGSWAAVSAKIRMILKNSLGWTTPSNFGIWRKKRNLSSNP